MFTSTVNGINNIKFLNSFCRSDKYTSFLSIIREGFCLSSVKHVNVTFSGETKKNDILQFVSNWKASPLGENCRFLFEVS